MDFKIAIYVAEMIFACDFFLSFRDLIFVSKKYKIISFFLFTGSVFVRFCKFYLVIEDSAVFDFIKYKKIFDFSFPNYNVQVFSKFLCNLYQVTFPVVKSIFDGFGFQ